MTNPDTRVAIDPMAFLVGAALVIGAVLGIFLMAGATDGVMQFHGLLFLAFCVSGVFWLIHRHYKAVPEAAVEGVRYDDGVVRAGAVLSVFWGVVGFLVGLVIALQLAFPVLNLDLPWTNFGRLRPLHTSAVIFAFGGNVLLTTSFFVVQRTCRARLAGGLAGLFVLAGYNLFIVIAATGYVLGVTQSKEYAEPEWYADLWLTLVWVIYLLVFLGTLWRRREPHIYVANWFFLAFIVTVAMLHIVNNLAVPVSWTGVKSYVVFAGVRDALTQWWYAHNAVGFFLTAGFLGIMYYFVPKRAERPIYSYRLSIVHFWTLIFLHAVDAVVGRHDQWPHDPVGRLGQAAHRPGHPHAGGLHRLLRHEHLRGAGHVHQGGQLAQPLHRLDHRPRPFRRAGLGRLRQLRRALLPLPRALAARAALFHEASGSPPSASCSTSRRCGSRGSCRA
jgi:hypothetical protein